MNSAASILVDNLRESALSLVQIAQGDFSKFVAPIMRDLDLIVSEPDERTREHLKRSMDAQLKEGVPELVRVTGQRAIADRIYSMTMLGANFAIGLATNGFINLADNLKPDDAS